MAVDCGLLHMGLHSCTQGWHLSTTENTSNGHGASEPGHRVMEISFTSCLPGMHFWKTVSTRRDCDESLGSGQRWLSDGLRNTRLTLRGWLSFQFSVSNKVSLGCSEQTKSSQTRMFLSGVQGKSCPKGSKLERTVMKGPRYQTNGDNTMPDYVYLADWSSC